jgi:hypothetical protein
MLEVEVWNGSVTRMSREFGDPTGTYLKESVGVSPEQYRFSAQQ